MTRADGGEPPVELPIEDTLDLHPFRPDEVASLVEEYLFQAAARGFRHVRIVHGRGLGVQRRVVQAILRRDPRVASFHDLPDRGSTAVSLTPRGRTC